jgi:hypothetical protein
LNAGQGTGAALSVCASAKAFWGTQSKALPPRPDGKPNRPLTAITVAFNPAEP